MKGKVRTISAEINNVGLDLDLGNLIFHYSVPN